MARIIGGLENWVKVDSTTPVSPDGTKTYFTRTRHSSNEFN
jgi:hypothetical protein